MKLNGTIVKSPILQEVISSLFVSSTHFAIACTTDPNTFVVHDYSTNGTYIDDELIGTMKTRSIRGEQKISIVFKGSVRHLFEFVLVNRKTGNESTDDSNGMVSSTHTQVEDTMNTCHNEEVDDLNDDRSLKVDHHHAHHPIDVHHPREMSPVPEKHAHVELVEQDDSNRSSIGCVVCICVYVYMSFTCIRVSCCVYMSLCFLLSLSFLVCCSSYLSRFVAPFVPP